MLKKFGVLQVNITSDTDIFLLLSRHQLQILGSVIIAHGDGKPKFKYWKKYVLGQL